MELLQPGWLEFQGLSTQLLGWGMCLQTTKPFVCVVWLNGCTASLCVARIGFFFQNNDDFSYFKDKRIINVDRSSVLPGSGVDCAHFSPIPDCQPNENLTFLMVSS